MTAGNKKDIIISNKIYTEKTAKVVIYGWHELDGNAIQPVYNIHTNMWADYSHGLRLIQQKVFLNNNGTITETTLKDILASKTQSYLLSDEDVIAQAFYPITKYAEY